MFKAAEKGAGDIFYHWCEIDWLTDAGAYGGLLMASTALAHASLFKVTQRSSFRASLKWGLRVFYTLNFYALCLSCTLLSCAHLHIKTLSASGCGDFSSLWQQSHWEYHVFPAHNSQVCMTYIMQQLLFPPQTSLTYYLDATYMHQSDTRSTS